jgi:DNA-binding XRE family transcriptional regulator
MKKIKRKPSDRALGPADHHVAARIMARRRELQVRQTYVARIVGVSFQQFGNYERGLDRITAGRLWQIAGALGVPVAYFYEGLPVVAGDVPAPPPAPAAGGGATSAPRRLPGSAPKGPAKPSPSKRARKRSAAAAGGAA